MRYHLRTLLILLAILPPALAWGWSEYGKYREAQRQREEFKEQLRRDTERIEKLRRSRTYPYFQLDVF